MPRLAPNPCLRAFFERMYPEIEVRGVSFREGLPWYVVAKPDAITIGNDIYFAPGKFQPCSASGIALIAHELFHIKQGAGGFGVWFLRPFYLNYVLQKVASGWTRGRKHPIEIPAYAHQDRVEVAYDLARSSIGVEGPCQCTGDRPGELHREFADAFFEALSRNT